MAETTPLTMDDHSRSPLELPINDVILANRPTSTGPRFLGLVPGEYRPVSGVSSLSVSMAGSRSSEGFEDSNDPSSPFFPKHEGYTSSSAVQSYHVLNSGHSPADDGLDLQGSKEMKSMGTTVAARDVAEKAARRKRRNVIIGSAALALLALIALAAILGALLGRKHADSANSNDGSLASIDGKGSASTGSTSSGNKLWGVGGDTIKTENGNTFVYNNTLGGTWVAIPFNDTAKPQADQPSLAHRWDYSTNRILGVNLGGWLVLEPFIVPSLFEPYADSDNPVVDEWTLCQTLGSKAAQTIENHYKTFITEQDFAQIAAAGLNWVRLPVGWWMIETWSGEPLVTGVSFKYFLKAITWARKYGLRINLDLHAVPGSQNGWNHSGRLGTVGFLHGVMGVANAQRTMNYVRTLAQFISQDQYTNVVPMFSVLNEAQLTIIGSDALRSWYYEVYQTLRAIGGVGESKGPFMVIHDGFGGAGGGQRGWDGYLQGADRLGLDTHSYLCFGSQNTDSVATNAAKPCTQWAPLINETLAGFGLNIVGEFSLAINDCGLFVNNVGAGTRYEGTFPTAATPDGQYKRVGSCNQWLDDGQWSDETKRAFADLAQTQQDSMRNSFFWTWKIGKSIKQSNAPNPMWNYQYGLQSGYIRPDARTSNGRCVDVITEQGGKFVSQPWVGPLAAWQTGGAGAGKIAPAQATQYNQFPPAVVSGASGGNNYAATALPSYVQTGTVVTLVPVATGSSSVNAGSGWAQSEDTAKWWVPQSGCNYPNPWNGVNAAAPTPVCGAHTAGQRVRRAAAAPQVTQLSF